ncbi:hypothetical protein IFM89_025518 [Coptis chinensis]|uniref:Uncharacterized protein n=1 Tax=Coptis chinensis TaxID=261450 RepID=A0A835H869_9MAGN|nr:hypothetical protein IFM89_025518 [Coptis chinensis]
MRWSFQKKSTRYRVLSNTVTLEIPFSGNKENLESTSNEFHAQNGRSVPEKISVSQWTEEMPPLSTTVNSKFSVLLIAKESVAKTDPLVSMQISEKNGTLVTKENTSEISCNLNEFSAIVVQAAIRAYLAIVKMQVLVRACCACVSLQWSTTEEKIVVALKYRKCRGLVLGHGALIPLLAQLNEHAKLSMLRNATSTLSNFSVGKPCLLSKQLIHSSDEEVLTDACWALSYKDSYLSDGTNDKIQVGVCPRLVELLM